jgi:hypothetical protein
VFVFSADARIAVLIQEYSDVQPASSEEAMRGQH